MFSSLLTIFFLGITAKATILGKRGLCPLHYVTGPHDSCFRFAEDKKTFNDALMQCESEGGTLANTQSNEAYEFVRQHIERNPVKANIGTGIFGEVSMFTPWANGWFVGAQKKGEWRWLNGQKLGGHWCRQMPDNWGGHEDCLEQMAGGNGWNDVPCDWRIRYVCQRKVLNPCDNVHCGNGRCIADKAKAVCLCKDGWKGADCNEKIVRDVCAGVRCRNGKCVASQGVGVCICHGGWTGSLCEKPLVDDPCAKNPCQNGGDCFSNKKGYFCRCRRNFNGKNCEKSCRFEVTKEGLPSKLDAMILFDGSMSVGVANFRKSLEFIARFVDKLHIGADAQRVEIVQFSHKTAEALDFASSARLSKEALKAKIAGIEYLKGGTATGKAMDRAVDIFYDAARKSDGVAKYLIVLTDGASNQGDEIRDAAQKLRSLGVELVAVGVGASVDREELLLIAGGKAANVFSVDTFEKLDAALISKMVEKLCD